MARYPVTVAQWRAYYAATGARVDERSLQRERNHPVVWVTWEDAVGYCAWLTDALRERAWAETAQPMALRRVPEVLATRLLEGDGGSGPWVVRLPSEAEWEKAARGHTASIYPWGAAADPNRANYGTWAEAMPRDHIVWPFTDLADTSAVGCFPGGASPYALEELAGNVWEWTRSEYRRYPSKPSDCREREDVSSTAPRVVRGGAFLSDFSARWDVRAAYRLWSVPDDRVNFIGFRVVVAPFPSDC